MNEPYARKGEWITCPNGHKQARFARDAFAGEVITPAMFDCFGDGIAPWKDGDLFGECGMCGEMFTGHDDPEKTKGAILIEGKWRR